MKVNDQEGLEQTFVVLKPDAIERRLMGRIISRFEDIGFVLLRAELKELDRAIVSDHYREHKDRDFFESLCSFMTISSVFLMVWSGKNIISVMRKCVGATDSALAAPGTIRGDFSLYQDKNLIHASDSKESALREIALFFPEN